MRPPQNLGTLLERAARAAGRVLSGKFRGRLSVRTKPGEGLVSEADEQAQAAAFRALKPLQATFNMIAEEAVNDRVWPKWDPKKPGILYIDPLDGTTNFVHGFPMFCVSVGAAWEGQLEAGVIWNPILRDLTQAQRGRGAYLNSKRLRPNKVRSLSEALLTTGFGYAQGHQQLAQVLSRIERVSAASHGIRRPGSAALDLAYTASGVFDGYWESQLKPWDVMGGALIAAEAGLIVTDLTGAPLSVPSSPEFMNICVAPEALHQPLLSLLASRVS